MKFARHQKYFLRADIFSGTRLIHVALHTPPPCIANIIGFTCRIWYKGQPVISVIHVIPVISVLGKAINRPHAQTRTNAIYVGRKDILRVIVRTKTTPYGRKLLVCPRQPLNARQLLTKHWTASLVPLKTIKTNSMMPAMDRKMRPLLPPLAKAP